MSASADLVARVEELAAAAPPLPLVRRVRIDKESLYDLLDELRTTFPEELPSSQR